MVAVALLAPPSPAAASRAARAPVRGGDPTVGFTEVKLTDREQLRAAAPLRRAERRPVQLPRWRPSAVGAVLRQAPRSQ